MALRKDTMGRRMVEMVVTGEKGKESLAALMYS
jgi:hypothetical protein